MSSDLSHTWGQDLVLSPAGNYEVSSGLSLTNQTIARFILTNPGDDPFNPTWGLGARKLIGQREAAAKLKTLILQGLATLDVVDQSVRPQVEVTASGYSLSASIAYVTNLGEATGIVVAVA